MPLSSEEVAELDGLLKTSASKMDPAYASWATEQVNAFKDKSLEGWAKAGGTKADAAPVVPGSLGLKGIIGGEKPSADAEAEALAAQLDPRFALIPQALALSPPTTHPGGTEAAKADWENGQRKAVIVYEPPVSAVRKQLLDNPALLRTLRPDAPPELDELANMTSDSPLYQDAANHMYRRAAEAAASAGRPIYRYSQLPWLWGDKSVPETLKLKLGALDAADTAAAFMLGVDDTGALGVGRAAQERASPTTMMSADHPTLGLNESVPQRTADLNAWNIEAHPLAFGGGQLLGAIWGAPETIWKGVTSGGEALLRRAAATGAGRLAARAPRLLKGAAGVAGDAAVGAVAAGAEQAGKEGVRLAFDDEPVTADRLAEAGERVKDVGQLGSELAAGGSLLGRAAHLGAETIRDSDRYRGLVRRTEPNLDWRLRRTFFGPTLNEEMADVVKEAHRGRYQPGDIIAEEIAPPIQKAAAENTQVARGRDLATRANFSRTAEGSAELPMTHLQEMSLERLRDHHQPRAGGGLRPVDDKYRDAAKVFNSLVDDVSMAPIEGAIKLSPDEAGAFLGPRQRYKLLEADIRAAAGDIKPVGRAEYLQTQPAAKRAAIDEEIEASIDDLLPADASGAPKNVDKRTAAYKNAEQQALRERVGEEMVLEPFEGSFAGYLRQRGKDAVYVKPAAYDARRADTLTKGLTDPDLVAAAKLDRQRRTAGGKPGGYAEMVEKGSQDVARAEAIEKRVAPGGDAFQTTARLAESRPGEKKLVDQVRDLAAQAGVREQYDRLRSLQDTLEVHNRARAMDPTGKPHYFNPTNLMDAAQLRVFPVLKALEGPLGPLRGGNAGRAALLGQPPEPSDPRESSARSRYEAARARRLAEIQREKDSEAEGRARRRRRREKGSD